MPVLNPGTTFANGEQLTASDLNLLLQGATFTQSSVDNQSTQLVGTAIVVADGGIIAAKLAADAVTTSKIKDANVTFAKLADVIDDDTMDTATDTTLATSESIKAYVDSNGITQTTGTAPYYGCRAWAFYNQATDTVEASGNIASIVRTATGYSTVTFTEPMPSAFYSIQIGGNGQVNVQHTIGFTSGIPTATGFDLGFYNAADSTKTANNTRVYIAVFA
jgi:hypothetical protein